MEIGYEGVESYFCFEGPEDHTIPKDLMTKIKKEYNWDYDIEKGKSKGTTTGYMAVKYIENLYPNQEITLVNFGYEVKKSSYRCPWHNWKFENEVLSKFPHIYTAIKEEHSKIEIVYCADESNIEKIESYSIKSVLKNNPNAHITILSEKPLNTSFDNIIVDMGKHNFKKLKANYLTLFLPKALSYDKIIYINANCICRYSLEELWSMNVPYIGLCHSHDFGKGQAEEIGIPYYGITGLMVMNLDALRKINFTEFALYALDHFKFPKTNWYCDETILNCCFFDRFKFLKTKWCFCYNRRYKLYGENVTSNEANVVYFIRKSI